RRIPSEGRARPHRDKGSPPQPLAQDLRLGQARTVWWEQGPPEDRPAARTPRRIGAEAAEDHSRRIPEGEEPGAGGCHPRRRQEQGRAAEGDRASARDGPRGAAAVRELPLTQRISRRFEAGSACMTAPAHEPAMTLGRFAAETFAASG